MFLHHKSENSPPPGLLTEVFKKKIKTDLWPHIAGAVVGATGPSYRRWKAASRYTCRRTPKRFAQIGEPFRPLQCFNPPRPTATPPLEGILFAIIGIHSRLK
jgi:hypothetical protein